MKPISKYGRCDAIILGARCTGATTAMLMGRQGARVLLVDRDRNLHGTLSTHVLLHPVLRAENQFPLNEQEKWVSPKRYVGLRRAR